MLNFQNIYPDIFGPYLKDEEASFEIHNLGQRINEFYKLTYRNSYKEIDCRSDRIILRMEEYDRDFLNANSQIKIYLNILEKLKDTPLFGKVRLSLMAIWAFYKLDTHLSEITNLFKDYYLSSDPVIYGQSLSDVMLAVEKDVNDDLHKFEIGPYTPDKDFFRFNLEKNNPENDYLKEENGLFLFYQVVTVKDTVSHSLFKGIYKDIISEIEKLLAPWNKK
ncbi:MAG: hypothetical protein HC880_01985 [Bacteroidia bacterium]|nr:hypothetical protein [Bacteroidia bacterium]